MKPCTASSPQGILHNLSINQPEEIDIFVIADALGAFIEYRPLTTCAACLLAVGRRSVITVDSRTSTTRQKFSIAHEIGHLINDRGQIYFACSEASLRQHSHLRLAEARANEFASELLMPRSMFVPVASELPFHFDSVRHLADRFGTSLSATAIRFVETHSEPMMLCCYKQGRFSWKAQSSSFPRRVGPRRQLHPESRIIQSKEHRRPEPVDLSAWFSTLRVRNQTLIEHTVYLKQFDSHLTLLWWPNCPCLFSASQAISHSA